MVKWVKRFSLVECDYIYKCPCGVLQEDYEYNADTGHYECSICGEESPDLDMIEIFDYQD